MAGKVVLKAGGVFAVTVFIFIIWAGSGLADPIVQPCRMNSAGLDVIKKSGKNPGEVLEKTIKSIPEKETWHLPVYPGAKFASRVGGSKTMFPSINLISDDPPEKVRKWYRKYLKGWTFDKVYKIFHEKQGKIDLGEMYTTQNINIMEETGDALDLMFFDVPNVKTRIQIMYDPSKLN